MGTLTGSGGCGVSPIESIGLAETEPEPAAELLWHCTQELESPEPGLLWSEAPLALLLLLLVAAVLTSSPNAGRTSVKKDFSCSGLLEGEQTRSQMRLTRFRCGVAQGLEGDPADMVAQRGRRKLQAREAPSAKDAALQNSRVKNDSMQKSHQ